MGWFGKITFGSLGLMLGGPLGAVVGAALGHHLVDKQQAGMPQQAAIDRAETAQAAYFVCVFSILGKLAGIDGTVSKEEIAAVENFISTLRLPDQEQHFARQVFMEARNSRFMRSADSRGRACSQRRPQGIHPRRHTQSCIFDCANVDRRIVPPKVRTRPARGFRDRAGRYVLSLRGEIF